ncbi:MAG: glycosyltransferase family 1 protein [Planctomycetota bacterium]
MITVEFDGLVLGRVASGVERYTQCLANYFAAHGEDTRVRIFTLTPSAHLDSRVEQLAVTGPEDLARAWLAKRTKGGQDIYHLPYFPLDTVQLLPLALAPRSVLMVHDLTFFHFPYLSDVERERRLRRFELTLKWATAIVTNSEFTRRDVLNEFDVPEEKVEVIYLGVQDHFLKPLDRAVLQSARKRLRLPDKFVLTVGRDYPHKNLYAVVEAFCGLARGGFSECGLVMAGETLDAEETRRITQLVRDRGLEGKIIRTGFVDDAELAALYQLAEVFVFPSLHEGFGFPAVEAMVSGTPVIAVKRTSIPEVCGDAALLVDEGTADEFARALRGLLEDANLRASLVDKGRKRAARFSWDAAARETHRVYDRILDERFRTKYTLEERERCWEEFHLLSYGEIADARQRLEAVEDLIKASKTVLPRDLYEEFESCGRGDVRPPSTP